MIKNENVRKTLNIIFWVAFAILAFIWIFDFFRVRTENDPVFCIRERTHQFDDGTVDECVGLGYKVYDYNREDTFDGIEFGPFFISMRE